MFLSSVFEQTLQLCNVHASFTLPYQPEPMARMEWKALEGLESKAQTAQQQYLFTLLWLVRAIDQGLLDKANIARFCTNTYNS